MEQLGEANTVRATREVLAAAEQEPAAALDDLSRWLVALDPIGFVDADPVDDLASLLGHDVKQVEDDFGVGAVGVSAHGRLHQHARDDLQR